MFPTAGPLGFPIGTASRMLVVKVDLRLKRSMSASGTFRTCRDFRVESAFGGKAEVGFRVRQGLLLAQSGPSISR
jgi:hypothetical protein